MATTEEKVIAWMKKNSIGGDRPWFDPNRTYYNLTIDQIIRVARHLNTQPKKKDVF